jgi:hypothetical protein
VKSLRQLRVGFTELTGPFEQRVHVACKLVGALLKR